MILLHRLSLILRWSKKIAGLSDEKLADPGASLYAGLATLVFIEQVAVNGNREQSFIAWQALPDALDNITSGITACYDLSQSHAAARARTPMKLEAVFS